MRQSLTLTYFHQDLNDTVSMPSVLDKPVACVRLKACHFVTDPEDSAFNAFSCNWIVQLSDVSTCKYCR